MRFSTRLMLLLGTLFVFASCASTGSRSAKSSKSASAAAALDQFGENDLSSGPAQEQSGNVAKETKQESDMLGATDAEVENELNTPPSSGSATAGSSSGSTSSGSSSSGSSNELSLGGQTSDTGSSQASDQSDANLPALDQDTSQDQSQTGSSQSIADNGTSGGSGLSLDSGSDSGSGSGASASDMGAGSSSGSDQGSLPPSENAGSGSSVNITNLQYDAHRDGGAIIVRTDGPADYTTRKNDANKQFILEIHNAVLPKRFQRPYITNEFPGEVASINAYQDPGSTTARVVVQLRDNMEPPVIQSGNTLLIEPNTNMASNSSSDDSDEDTGNSSQSTASAPAPVSSFEDYLTGRTKFVGRKIDIQADDENIRNVFDLIAQESGANIVLDSSVKGKISVRLRHVPWDQAMVVIMKAKQLGYVREGNVLRVAPLSQLKQEADLAAAIEASHERTDPLVVKVVPVNYANVQKIAAQAKPFLTPRGRIVGDNHSSSVVVTDVPSNVDRIIKLIHALDIVPDEVLIEGKIVEAQAGLSSEMGINWTVGGQGIPVGTSSGGVPINLTPTWGVSRGSTNNAPAGGDLGLTLGTLDYLGTLQADLQLYEQKNMVKIISAPRIVTMNKENATITQDHEIAIPQVTNVQGTIQTTYIYRKAQLKLVVTPQITPSGGVIMKIDVLRQAFGAAEANHVRPEESREAKTTVLVQSGQTAVIGGIYDNNETDTKGGVPGLDEIPFLGFLFRYHDHTMSRNELMIFLTPRILSRNSPPSNETSMQ